MIRTAVIILVANQSYTYHIAMQYLFSKVLWNFEFPANDSNIKFRYYKTERITINTIIFSVTRPHFLCNCKHCDKSYETHRKRTCNSKRWLCNNSCLNTKMAWWPPASLPPLYPSCTTSTRNPYLPAKWSTLESNWEPNATLPASLGPACSPI